MHEFEDDFFKILEKVEATTTLIDDEVDVRIVYGIRRPARRGVTT
jgi:hypothetical protein